MLIKKKKKKTSDTSGLVATTLLNTKISGLVKETDYDTKIGERKSLIMITIKSILRNLNYLSRADSFIANNNIRSAI